MLGILEYTEEDVKRLKMAAKSLARKGSYCAMRSIR